MTFRRGDPDIFLVYVGIDPGVTGSAVFIGSEYEIYGMIDWLGDEFMMFENLRKILSFIEAEKSPKRVQFRAALEFAASRPGQASTGMFTFATNYGIWRGFLAGLGIPFNFVTPQVWQKGIPGLKPGDKNKLLRKKVIAATAKRMYPAADVYGPRGGLKAGRGDAIMIADWCRRH